MSFTVQGAYVATPVASGTIVTTTSTTFTMPVDLHSACFFLSVSAASGTSETLDVNIETSFDAGGTYFGVFRFAQVTTSATARRLIACFFGGSGNTATTATNAGGGNEQVIATAGTGGALSTGCPVEPRYMRIRAVVGGTNPSYTYLVGYTALPFTSGISTSN